jgi:hypothetical protein
MNRPDHQVCPIAPRVLRAFSPPSTGSGRDDSDHHGLFTDGLLRQREHAAQVGR